MTKKQSRVLNKPRLIIMRHSERLDCVVRDPNWPSEAFINGVYSPNIQQLPTVLPIRTNPNEYILDTPLTKYGQAHAYHTGTFFRSLGLVPNRTYTSPAMRCVQTADSVLDGLGVRENQSLKVDLALHEPARKELPIQSAEFFASVNFNISLKYHPILSSNNNSKILVHESRLEYYHRLFIILKRIIKKLTNDFQKDSSKSSSTTLIITHRSCVTLLAAMLNLNSIDENINYLYGIESNKRNEVQFLSMIIAEYDPLNGLWTFLSDFSQIASIK